MKRNRLSPSLVAVVMRQLADALRSGLSLHDTLAILGKDTDLGKRHIQLISYLNENLAAGGALSSAFAEYPGTFPSEAVAFVRSGEQAGTLAESLDMLAMDFEMRAMQRMGIKGALAWPIAIMVVLLLMASTIMIFVIPAFKQVFSSFGADLPGPTLLVMALSDFAVQYWWVAVGLAGMAFYLKKFIDFRIGRIALLDTLVMKIPFVRSYMMKAFISRLGHILTATTARGLPAAPAMAYLRSTAGNFQLSKLAGAIEAQLAEGKDIVTAVRDTPAMPGHLVVALELGTRANNVDAALRQVVKWGEGEAARSLVRLQQVFLVSAYVAVGLTVGCVVIAMYLPIFKLGSVV